MGCSGENFFPCEGTNYKATPFNNDAKVKIISWEREKENSDFQTEGRSRNDGKRSKGRRQKWEKGVKSWWDHP